MGDELLDVVGRDLSEEVGFPFRLGYCSDACIHRLHLRGTASVCHCILPPIES